MTDKQKELFNACCSILRNIPDINAGGCGIAAYSIYLYFKKYDCLTENFQVILMDILMDNSNSLWSDSHERNKEFLEGRCGYAQGAAHIGITFDAGQTIYDCNGRFYPSQWPDHLLVPHNKIDHYMDQALIAKNWNPDFDRYSGIPLIAGALGIDLSKFMPEKPVYTSKTFDEWNNLYPFS